MFTMIREYSQQLINNTDRKSAACPSSVRVMEPQMDDLHLTSYIKSLVSALQIDRKAKIKEITVNITGKIALFAIVRSPIFACVKTISRNEEIIVAFEDFIAIPINNAMKLIVTITMDFTINWI